MKTQLNRHLLIIYKFIISEHSLNFFHFVLAETYFLFGTSLFKLLNCYFPCWVSIMKSTESIYRFPFISQFLYHCVFKLRPRKNTRTLRNHIFVFRWPQRLVKLIEKLYLTILLSIMISRHFGWFYLDIVIWGWVVISYLVQRVVSIHITLIILYKLTNIQHLVLLCSISEPTLRSAISYYWSIWPMLSLNLLRWRPVPRHRLGPFIHNVIHKREFDPVA